MAHIEDRWKHAGDHGRKRWRVRYLDLDGKERSRSFDKKGDAERFKVQVEADVLRGTYMDPDVGKVTLRKYAAEWLAMQPHDTVTGDSTEVRLRVHIYPALGGKTLVELAARPSMIQAWASGLKLAPSSARGVLSLLSSVMAAAVRDGLISKNPCVGTKLAKPVKRLVVPWTPAQRAAQRAGLSDRYQAIVDAGCDLGLRQSELFGLSVENIDFLHRMVHVRQQVKLIRGRLYFAAPKAGKERSVPLAAQLGLVLSAHIAACAVEVTLPWHEPGDRRHGRDHTAKLLFTTEAGRALQRSSWNEHAWRPALRKAGLPSNERTNGCHIMRHTFASTLVGRGVDPRTVAEYLGHSDGGALVLRTYSHLLPDAEDRARKALEDALEASETRSDGPVTAQRQVNRP
jgi:integrase